VISPSRSEAGNPNNESKGITNLLKFYAVGPACKLFSSAYNSVQLMDIL
jgi:hypothetical protein